MKLSTLPFLVMSLKKEFKKSFIMIFCYNEWSPRNIIVFIQIVYRMESGVVDPEQILSGI